jgi:hypothetical protein
LPGLLVKIGAALAEPVDAPMNVGVFSLVYVD